MLPFLKDRMEGGVSAPVEVIHRKPDEDSDMEFGMLDAIVEDMLEAVAKKDKELLKGCLEALIEHIQDEDMKQDEEEME